MSLNTYQSGSFSAKDATGINACFVGNIVTLVILDYEYLVIPITEIIC